MYIAEMTRVTSTHLGRERGRREISIKLYGAFNMKHFQLHGIVIHVVTQRHLSKYSTKQPQRYLYNVSSGNRQIHRKYLTLDATRQILLLMQIFLEVGANSHRQNPHLLILIRYML